MLRYASGEAARLSIGREGFDLPTERQFEGTRPVAQRKSAALRTRDLRRFDSCRGGHSRKVVRGGAQPVSKTGPTSRSKVRLLRLPPFTVFASLSCCRSVKPVSMKQAGRPTRGSNPRGRTNSDDRRLKGARSSIRPLKSVLCLPDTRTWLNGRVPERHSGGVGSTPAVRANSSRCFSKGNNGTIAQLGEQPPCKRKMRVQVPLAPPAFAAARLRLASQTRSKPGKLIW